MLITDVRQASPNVITALFRAHGIINNDEQVTKVRHLSKQADDLAVTHLLALQYKDFQTQRHSPDHVMLRISLPDADPQPVRNEVLFYERVAAPLAQQHDRRDLPAAFCYDAYYDPEQQRAHLVLQSTNKYQASTTGEPPAQRHREQLIDSLALLHGYWWAHPSLGELTDFPTQESMQQIEDDYRDRYDAMIAFVGGQLSAPHRDALSVIVQGIPAQRRQHLIDGNRLTAIHGALEPAHILYSHEGTLIKGWHQWRGGTGTDDLAYMMGCFWSDHLRKFQEKAMLKRYYSGLQKAGVTGYSYDDLEYDYRASLAQVVGRFLLGWTKQKHLRGYWQQAERALDVFIAWDGEQVITTK